MLFFFSLLVPYFYCYFNLYRIKRKNVFGKIYLSSMKKKSAFDSTEYVTRKPTNIFQLQYMFTNLNCDVFWINRNLNDLSA